MASDLYYFYRCRRCFSLITRLQMQSALRFSAEVCACGSGTIGPTNPIGREWMRPRVLQMVLYRLLGLLDAAPEPTEHIPIPKGILTVPALSAEELVGDDE